MATAKKAAPVAKKTGTAVAVKKASGGALVDIKAQMAAELAGLAGRTGAAGGDKIQLKDKKFTLPDGTTCAELDVVIVDFINVNNFYDGTYDQKNPTPPACFAIGQVITTMVPSPNAPLIQSDACGACPMNQYESSGSGAGKACKNMRRLAVLPPDADADTPLWIIDVSPTGIKGFDAYVRSAASKFQLPPIGLVTTLTFDPDKSYPSLRFGNPQANENMESHWARKGEALERLMQEPDVSGFEQKPPPKTTARKAAVRR